MQYRDHKCNQKKKTKFLQGNKSNMGRSSIKISQKEWTFKMVEE